MKNLLISVVFFQFFYQIASIKFGFIVKDEANVLSKKFVAFGSILQSTEKDLREIGERLNSFYRHNRLEKFIKKEIDSPDFTVSLHKKLDLPNGDYQVTLKGDLSGFLALLAVTMKNLIDSTNIWDEINFYSDPIVIMSRENYFHAPNEFKLTLLKPAFDNVDIILSEDLDEYNPRRTMSQAAREKTLEAYNYLKFDTVEDELTVIEFYPSIKALQNPLVESSPSLRQRIRKRLRCTCDSCNIL